MRILWRKKRARQPILWNVRNFSGARKLNTFGTGRSIEADEGDVGWTVRTAWGQRPAAK